MRSDHHRRWRRSAPRRPIIESLAIAGAATFILLAAGCSRSTPAAPAPAAPPGIPSASSPRVVLSDGATIQVEIASDDATREQGLMFRDRLARDHGMIFLFSHAGLYPFWMKNTLIPLDMIWIGGDGKVVHLESNVRPCKADPCPSYGAGSTPALYVLETAAGVAAEHHVTEGSQLRLVNLEHVIVQ